MSSMFIQFDLYVNSDHYLERLMSAKVKTLERFAGFAVYILQNGMMLQNVKE